MKSKNENSLEIVSDKNLNLNRNLLGGEGMNIQNVRTHKGGQAKCVRLRTRGEGASNFDNICVYVLRG